MNARLAAERLTIAALVAGLVACGSSSHPASSASSVPAKTGAATVDPTDGQTATVSTLPSGATQILMAGGPFIGSVASADGAIWVGSHSGVGIYRIDPQTNRLTAFIRVGEGQCLPTTAALHRLWVTNCWGDQGQAYVYEVDTSTNRVVHRYDGASTAYGDGSLWMGSDDRTALLRIDPATRQVIARIKLPEIDGLRFGAFVAAECGGAVWLDANLSEIKVDAATNRVAAVIKLPHARGDWTTPDNYNFSAASAACADGKVFVPNLAGLYAIDTRTNVATRLPVAIKPNSQLGDPGTVADGNRVFVRSSDTTVTEVDATTGRAVHTYPAGGGGGDGIAVGAGAVWVPAAADGAVWRDQITG
jgi:outer membrane protein assembly factor BamB